MDRLWQQQIDFNFEWASSWRSAGGHTDLHQSSWAFDVDYNQVPVVQEIHSQTVETKPSQALLLSTKTGTTSKQCRRPWDLPRLSRSLHGLA